MGSYRFEEAPSGRAGCTNKECKDAKIKIAKGELRAGSWVDRGDFQTYYWRHWGCVTPKIIANILDALKDPEGDSDSEIDFEVLDGYDDLSEENQAKIRKALEQGHVDDEDWKGDAELNRPGMTGFRDRGTKNKAAEQEEGEDKASPAKKRTHADANNTKEEDEKPAKKAKKPARGKKAADDEEADSDAAPPKKGRRTTKAAAEEAKAKPKQGTKGAKSKAANGDHDAQPAEKPKRGRPKKAAAENGDDAEPKPKRGRKKAESK